MLRPLLLTTSLLLTSLLALSSCGVPVCVAGIGECSAYFDKVDDQPTVAPTSTVSPNGALTISGVTTVSLSSPVVTYTASGGSGSYTFTISPVGCGTFNLFMPGQFTATLAANCIITVTDTSVPIRNGTLNITITL